MTQRSDACRPTFSQLAIAALCWGAGSPVASARPHGASKPRIDLFEPAATQEVFNHLGPRVHGFKDICIANVHAAPGPKTDWAQLASDNRQAYAKRHNYNYFEFTDRVSGPNFLNPEAGDETTVLGGGLTWQKLSAVAATLDQFRVDATPECTWTLWMDADAIVTNPRMTLEALIHHFSESDTIKKDVILSREEIGYPGTFVNSGTFMVKNSWAGRAFLNGAANYFDKYKLSATNDQDAMQEYTFGRSAPNMHHAEYPMYEAHKRPEIVLAPQRAMNSFCWDSLPLEGRWQTCDFIAHFLQAPSEVRLEGMRLMIESSKNC